MEVRETASQSEILPRPPTLIQNIHIKIYGILENLNIRGPTARV